MKILLLLVVQSLCAVAAQAEVLVYKGTAQVKLPSAVAQVTALPHVYFIVDIPGRTAYILYYFTKGGKKNMVGTPAATPFRYASQTLSATKTIGSFSGVDDDNGTTNYNVGLYYLRGTEHTLTLRAGTTGQYPRTVTGFGRLINRNNGGALNSEFNYVLSYDSAQSQSQNALFRNGSDAALDIQGQLAGKGY